MADGRMITRTQAIDALENYRKGALHLALMHKRLGDEMHWRYWQGVERGLRDGIGVFKLSPIESLGQVGQEP